MKDGFTLGLSVPSGLQFRLQPPPGFSTAIIVVDLTWCSDSSVPANSSDHSQNDYLTTTSLALHNVRRLNGDHIELFSSPVDATISSVVYEQGSCFTLRAKSLDLGSEHIAFDGLSINLVVEGFNSSALTAYSPVSRGGGVMVQYTSMNMNPLPAQDPGVGLFVNDNQPPKIVNCPANVYATAPAGQLETTVRWAEPLASDNVKVASMVSPTPAGSSFTIANSPHLVTYTATDSTGLTSTCVFNVTVLYEQRAINITILVNGNISHSQLTSQLSLSQHSNALLHDLALTHPPQSVLVDPALAINAFSIDIVGDSTQVFAVRPSRTQGGKEVRVEVDLRFRVEDFTEHLKAPLAFTSLQFINATSLDGNGEAPAWTKDPKWFASNAITTTFDLVSGSVRLSGASRFFSESLKFAGLRITLSMPDIEQASSPFTIGVSNRSFVRFSYYERANPDNASHQSAFLQIFDNEPPIFDNCPANITMATPPGLAKAMVAWRPPSVSDNQGVLSVTPNFQPGSNFGIGETSVFYYASDEYGNTAQCRFNVIVRDNEPPSLDCPANLTFAIAANASAYTQAPGEVVFGASDNTGSFSINSFKYSNNRFIDTTGIIKTPLKIGIHRIQLIATDPSNNNASCSFTITVKDITPPTIVNCPSDQSLSTSDALGTTATWTLPSATDNDGLPVVLASSHTPKSFMFPEGSTQVMYTATDSSGNTASCAFIVEVTVVQSGAAASSDLTTSAIAGSVVVVTVVCIALVVVLVLWRRSHRVPDLKPHDFNELLAALQDIQSDDGPRKPREILRSAIVELEELGHGHFGSVSKATLSEIKGQPGYIVAVKVLHQSAGEDRKALLQEAAVMAQFEHNRVVRLIGVVTVGSPLMVVMEYCEHGALNNYLAKFTFSIEVKLSMAGDCADGLAYLTSRGFVHRDIAARNVLISSDRRAKIADFGMSRETSAHEYYKSRNAQMPIRWTAPEALDEGKFSAASDVWSFGVLMYEIWTRGDTPYKDIQNVSMVHVMVTNGYRLPCPDDCPTEVHALMLECWHTNPHDRPTFPHLSTQLDQLVAIRSTLTIKAGSPSSPARSTADSPSTVAKAHRDATAPVPTGLINVAGYSGVIAQPPQTHSNDSTCSSAQKTATNTTAVLTSYGVLDLAAEGRAHSESVGLSRQGSAQHDSQEGSGALASMPPVQYDVPKNGVSAEYSTPHTLKGDYGVTCDIACSAVLHTHNTRLSSCV